MLKDLGLDISHDKDDNLTVSITMGEGDVADIMVLMDKIKTTFYEGDAPQDNGDAPNDLSQFNPIAKEEKEDDGPHVYRVARLANPTSKKWNRWHIFRYDAETLKYYAICGATPGGCGIYDIELTPFSEISPESSFRALRVFCEYLPKGDTCGRCHNTVLKHEHNFE